jgi:hypothetical protein
LRRRLTALFVTVGVFAQFAWLAVLDEVGNDEDPVPASAVFLVVGSVGAALLFCAVLLYVPEGIQRARQAHRDNQEFKDRFR